MNLTKETLSIVAMFMFEKVKRNVPKNGEFIESGGISEENLRQTIGGDWSGNRRKNYLETINEVNCESIDGSRRENHDNGKRISIEETPQKIFKSKKRDISTFGAFSESQSMLASQTESKHQSIADIRKVGRKKGGTISLDENSVQKRTHSEKSIGNKKFSSHRKILRQAHEHSSKLRFSLSNNGSPPKQEQGLNSRCSIGSGLLHRISSNLEGVEEIESDEISDFNLTSPRGVESPMLFKKSKKESESDGQFESIPSENRNDSSEYLRNRMLETEKRSGWDEHTRGHMVLGSPRIENFECTEEDETNFLVVALEDEPEAPKGLQVNYHQFFTRNQLLQDYRKLEKISMRLQKEHLSSRLANLTSLKDITYSETGSRGPNDSTFKRIVPMYSKGSLIKDIGSSLRKSARKIRGQGSNTTFKQGSMASIFSKLSRKTKIRQLVDLSDVFGRGIEIETDVTGKEKKSNLDIVGDELNKSQEISNELILQELNNEYEEPSIGRLTNAFLLRKDLVQRRFNRIVIKLMDDLYLANLFSKKITDLPVQCIRKGFDQIQAQKRENQLH